MATSSTAMMLPTELYWMFGWLGVLFGMTMLGILYAWCWKFLLTNSAWGALPSAALFAFVVRAVNLEESHALYANAEPITLVVYVYGLHWVQRMAFPELRASQRREIKKKPLILSAGVLGSVRDHKKHAAE